MANVPKYRILLAAGVAALAMAATAILPGTAGAAKISPEDCETLSELGDNIGDTGSSTNIFGKQAKAIAEGFDETADDIQNAKLRKAMKGLADFYDQLAGVNSIVEAGKISAEEGRRFARAMKVWTKASLQCLTAEITIPTNVTLPQGVTVPTIPR